ncbi:hypothetical protein FBU30_004514 [Linnemannia zychae]|nr:hypothetical protein FBU30_004514 [Linnemannia zychae]
MSSSASNLKRKEEIDRFCDAMVVIYTEFQEIQDGKWSQKDNVLNSAPHTLTVLMKDDELWNKKSYTCLQVALPSQVQAVPNCLPH